MSDLFERSKFIGLQSITQWLPDGRQEGDEWVARNPTRNDSSLGSFKVNLRTGKWADWADGPEAVGGDAVSLYAYINGIRQGEAAKEILTRYDPSYFPNKNDDFQAGRDTKDHWADAYPQIKGTKNPPPLDTEWHQKQLGEEVGRWSFVKNGQIVLWVVRFVKDGKKDDRPFTLWMREGKLVWRNKGFSDTPYPLWNLDALAARQTDPVLMFEGQKDAAKLEPILRDDYVVVGFYGGAGRIAQTDLEPLRGREVWYCPDADDAGRKVLKTLRELDIKVHIIRAPLGCAKGWSLADEDLDRQGYLDWLAKDDPEALDDFWSVVPVDIRGVKDGKLYVYSREAETVFEDPWASLTKNHFMRWLPKDVWAIHFPSDKGVSWDNVVNFVHRRAAVAGIFNPSVIRCGGAWIDNGEVVVSTGEAVFSRGRRWRMGDFESQYIYVKSDRKAYSFEDPIPNCKVLQEVIGNLSFVHPSHNLILLGWLLLAPYGGVLNWRPNLWLIGESGSGKSTIFNIIIERILGGIAVFGKGLTTTPAGVRQGLNNASVPFVMDEMESKDPITQERHSQILTMFRESSSGLGSLAKTLHGSSGGDGKHWIVQSMVVFGSIGAALEDSADRSRFTVITLQDPNSQNKAARLEKFKKLEAAATGLTAEWVSGFHARTLRLMPEVFQSIKTMVEIAIPITNSRRDADQIGTIMAGAWMAMHDKAPTAAQAAEFLKILGSEATKDHEESKPDQEIMMDHILTAEIQVEGHRLKVGRALVAVLNGASTEDGYLDRDISQEALKAALIDIGLKPVRDQLHVAINHPDISRVLAKTPWSKTYSQMLPRLECCSKEAKGGGRFSGIQKRYYVLNLKELLDEVPF